MLWYQMVDTLIGALFLFVFLYFIVVIIEFAFLVLLIWVLYRFVTEILPMIGKDVREFIWKK